MSPGPVTAEEAAAALFGRRNGQGFLCRCPLPDHGRGRGDRTPSLSIVDGEEGLVVNCFGLCDPVDVLAELQRLFPGRPLRRRHEERKMSPRAAFNSRVRVCSDLSTPNQTAVGIWGCATVGGELVDKYLRVHRGIGLRVPPSLRQGSTIVFGHTPVHTMVAAVQSSARRVIAVQELRLTSRGTKSPMSVPRVTTGKLHDGAVRLAAAGDILGLAEGIETGLSAMEVFDIPIWCSLGASRLTAVGIPTSVRELHLFADNDAPGTKAADEAARYWERRGLKVIIHIPPEEGADWNDELRSRKGVSSNLRAPRREAAA